MPNMDPKKCPMPVQDPDVRNKNFKEVTLGYTAEMAINEAKRCLQCKKPHCVEGCPVNIHIPEFIHEVAEGNFEKAYEIITDTNALPALSGRVCPQETQCESKCVRGNKGEPVAIGRLERFVADWYRENINAMPKKAESNGIKVAVVGSGPSGLTCASLLAKKGYAVSLFEALHTAGGVLVYGIPEFRLPKAIVANEVEKLKAQGVEVMTDMVIGKVLSIDELFEMGFKAVFIGSGAGLPMFMHIPGESLKGVCSANEYLTRINLMKAYLDTYDTPIKKIKRAAIVGGGNVAMDVTRSSVRLGAASVTCVYRRRIADMTALPDEVQGAIAEGAEIRELSAPVRIEANEAGEAAALWVQPQIIGLADKSGRPRPDAADQPKERIPADIIVVAIGQGVEIAGFEQAGIPIKRGTFMAESSSQIDNMENVFAGGDCVTGPATAIRAIAAGKVAAANIDEQLGFHHEIRTDVEIPAPHLDVCPARGRVNTKEREAAQRKCDFEDIECGMTHEEACAESGRCLRCDHFGYGIFKGGRIERW